RSTASRRCGSGSSPRSPARGPRGPAARARPWTRPAGRGAAARGAGGGAACRRSLVRTRHRVKPDNRHMRTERQKMLAGEMYDPFDPGLVAARERARDLCAALNVTRDRDADQRRRILQELFGIGGDTVWMQPPFYCDYGTNIELGERVFFNFNCVVLDVCRVRIGSYSLFGPAVQ